MKKYIINSVCALLVLQCCSQHLEAQCRTGIVKEGLIVKSKILGKDVRYTVYLPYDYETSSRFYPVVYLFHGYTDNDNAWIQFGEAQRLADQAILSGEIPPMILVTPDAGVSWYINNYDGSVRYEDFFFQEFIPTIEKQWRIRSEKRFRGIAGLSMGGYGATLYALKHPELFAACAAFSAALFTEEEIVKFDSIQWNKISTVLYGPNLLGEERLTPHLRANNPFFIIRALPVEKLKEVRWYFDCGDDDFLYKGNSTLHILLRDLKVPHEFRMRDGGHQWSYWRTGLIEGLKFIGTSFHQP
ncbi:MAG: esterase family protein [Bacteroidetes bacterium]|nr:esterase family protein [Bacteroidota bacterium]